MSKIQIEMDMFSLGGKVVGFIVTKRKKQNGDVRRNDTRDTFFFFFLRGRLKENHIKIFLPCKITIGQLLSCPIQSERINGYQDF